MSKKLCFEVHTYAPELSKVYFIRNGKKIQYELPSIITKEFKKDYAKNVKLIRQHEKKNINKRHVKITLETEINGKIHQTIRQGNYASNIQILSIINNHRQKNEGYKDIISYIDKETGKADYIKIYCNTSYSLQFSYK